MQKLLESQKLSRHEPHVRPYPNYTTSLQARHQGSSHEVTPMVRTKRVWPYRWATSRCNPVDSIGAWTHWRNTNLQAYRERRILTQEFLECNRHLSRDSVYLRVNVGLLGHQTRDAQNGRLVSNATLLVLRGPSCLETMLWAFTEG